ncbi:hypothetical protein [Natrarchaeobius oligotrophus]|uniref:DUF7974 domain-containing protein n=1 Tax=Natrarchaeobius chitinivorans TaxID=1679083 RepID=A0A3N6MG22_NATCH|nr:hypothetical protein [Natrarchaeobius chitinivorans]RQG99924.1 hypothetical protein EA472_11895 [Natrarchaeobius chitinivorans]
MRRIYDSDALERDDDDPFRPSGRDEPASRSIDWAAFSHAFVPVGLRTRAIDVGVSTNRTVYEVGQPVRIEFEFRNRLPFPIAIPTDSPNVWTWAVDDASEADAVSRTVPDRSAAFSFARGERKRFRRTWCQRIRVDDDEWQPVGPGTYALEVRISREDAHERGLVDRTTIEITNRR